MSEAGGMKVFEGMCVHVDVLMVENMFFFHQLPGNPIVASLNHSGVGLTV